MKPPNTAGPSDLLSRKFKSELLIQHHRDKRFHVQGIGTLIHYPVPPHKQEGLTELGLERHPIAEQLHDTVLSIPMSPVLTEEEVDQVIAGLNSFTP